MTQPSSNGTEHSRFCYSEHQPDLCIVWKSAHNVVLYTNTQSIGTRDITLLNKTSIDDSGEWGGGGVRTGTNQAHIKHPTGIES